MASNDRIKICTAVAFGILKTVLVAVSQHCIVLEEVIKRVTKMTEGLMFYKERQRTLGLFNS